jgi:hypothetical protein
MKSVYKAVKQHRPNLPVSKFHDKLSHYERRGLIKHTSRGVIALTQAGRRDTSDPVETAGLPTWHPMELTSKPEVLMPATKPAPNPEAKSKHGPGNHTKEHMAKMTASRLAKGSTSKRKLNAREVDKPRQKGYEDPIGTPSATVTIAGQQTQVDAGLIERLLAQNPSGSRLASLEKQIQNQAELIKRQREVHAQQDHMIDLPIGIRLKVTVEVV